MISGVCMGLAEYMHIDVTFIRILFVVFALVTSGWGILVYGVLMFVVPKVDTRARAGDSSRGTCRRIAGRGTTGGRGTSTGGRGTNTDGRGNSRAPSRPHARGAAAARSPQPQAPDPRSRRVDVRSRRAMRRRRARRGASGATSGEPQAWPTTR